MQKNFHLLSEDELQNIFSFLDIGEKSNCYRVCIEWAELIYTPLSNIDDFVDFMKKVTNFF